MRGNKDLAWGLLQKDFFYWGDEQNFGLWGTPSGGVGDSPSRENADL